MLQYVVPDNGSPGGLSMSGGQVIAGRSHVIRRVRLNGEAQPLFFNRLLYSQFFPVCAKVPPVSTTWRIFFILFFSGLVREEENLDSN